MKYLLDTNTCIFYLKKKYNLRHKIQAAGLVNFCISEITSAELFYGAYKGEFIEENLEKANDFIKGLIVIPISDCLHIFGQEKAKLKKIGKLIGDFDILIGTTALYYDLIVVSQNTRHINRLTNIKLVLQERNSDGLRLTKPIRSFEECTLFWVVKRPYRFYCYR